MRRDEFNEAGGYKQRLTLERPALERDDLGGAVGTWVAVRDIWAKVEALTEFEQFAQGTTQHKATHKVTCYYMHDLQPDWRFTYSRLDGSPPVTRRRVLKITGIRNVKELNRKHIIRVAEGPHEEEI